MMVESKDRASQTSPAGTDCRGVPISYPDPSAIAALEKAHESTLAFCGNALADINEIIACHPHFIAAHLFKVAWLTQAMETRIYDEMVQAVEAAERLIDGANDRERGHLEAVQAWIRGDFFGAIQKWEAVLTRYPLDLLALQLIHLTDVLLGDVVGQRDVVARVFNLWDEGIPGYEFVLGFYAFGLEENRDFQQAEEMGRQSLAIRPGNPYAVHAVCHVMEMNGRQTGGLRFMYERSKTGTSPTLPITCGGTPLSCTWILKKWTGYSTSMITICDLQTKRATNTKNWILLHSCGV